MNILYIVLVCAVAFVVLYVALVGGSRYCHEADIPSDYISDSKAGEE